MRFCAIVGHVIGHDILDPAQALAVRLLDQRFEGLVAAELGIEPVRIDHVIAVPATRARVKNRRGINIADAEVVQIRQNLARFGEAEVRRELQAIGGRRDLHCSAATAAPLLRRTRRDATRGSPLVFSASTCFGKRNKTSERPLARRLRRRVSSDGLSCLKSTRWYPRAPASGPCAGAPAR